MINVINREPAAGQAGKVKLTLDDGTVMTGTLEMSDGATTDGTPWNAQTGKLLQADIRTYPAASAINAGDVVDISDGQATNTGTPSQGIALQTVQAGASIEVIFSGCAYADWITDGQIIDSPGVQGFSPVDGVLCVIPLQQRVVSSIGTFTSSVTLPFVPDVVWVVVNWSATTNAGGDGSAMLYPNVTARINGGGTAASITNIFVTWNGNTSISCSGNSDRIFRYVALKFGGAS